MSSLDGRPTLRILGAVVCLISIPLTVLAYRRALAPLYGSGTAVHFLHEILLATTLVATAKQHNLHKIAFWALPALCLSLAPKATYWVAAGTARRQDPVWGPAMTHLVVLFPLIYYLSSRFTALFVGSPALFNTWRATVASFALCSISGIFLPDILSRILPINRMTESQIFLTLASIFWNLLIIDHTPSIHSRLNGNLETRSKFRFVLLATFITFWWTVHPYLASPVLPQPLRTPYKHKAAPLRVLSSVTSTTGLIVVAESLASPDSAGQKALPPFRYLRASHSLLGGVWTGDSIRVLDDQEPAIDSFGNPLGDSIYAAFALQEAARLVIRTNRTSESHRNALIIGLGVGTAATGFLRHGMSTTIVEIDPAVYEAARMYFGLPDPGEGQVFLQDARQWTADRRRLSEGSNIMLYDIVVHDCFSGGGVPEHIFTFEFWEDLKTAIHPEGVLVVNLAGELKSDGTRMVLATLEKSFAHCRAFHDHMEPLTEPYTSKFVNIVFFCTNSPSPLSFRKAGAKDYLGSPLRRLMFDSLLTREIRLDLIRDPDDVQNPRYLLTDAHNPLGRLQKEQSRAHWKLMRQVLPDVHWETY